MIELVLAVNDGVGGERIVKDFFVDSSISTARLRSLVVTIGPKALAKYESSQIGEEDFPPGFELQVLLAVRKQRGYLDSNTVVSYQRATAAPVVQIRSAG